MSNWTCLRTCGGVRGALLASTVVVGQLLSGGAAMAEPSGELTVAWPRVFSFVGVPSQNGGRQGERLVWAGVHETPLYINSAGEIVPNLAESWTVSEDGLVHTVKLREGVQFHGGWGEMTAEDWAYTAQDQWHNPTSNHGGQFIAKTNLNEVKVVDDYTVQFILNKPNAFFKEYYGAIRDDVALATYSKKRAEELGPEGAVTELPDGGTGPYQIESWTADNEIVLKAFPNYWGDEPEYETIRIVQISEPSTVMAALETGTVDAAKIPVTSRERAEAAGLAIGKAGISFGRLIFAGTFCYDEFDGEVIPPRPGYDPSIPWVGDCDDPESMEQARQVRHAMSIAIDREGMVQALAGGHGEPSYVEMLQGYFADRYMQDKWVVPYDPELAKQMLADAGFPDGFEVDLVCDASGHPLQNQFCDAVGSMWNNIGLNTKIRRLSPDAFRQQQVERSFNGIKLEVEPGPTPIPEARGFGELPTAAFNSGFEMPGLVELVREASLAISDEERDAIREKQYDWSSHMAFRVPLIEFDEIYAYDPAKIASWDRTPFNGHSAELMDFEAIKKPE